MYKEFISPILDQLDSETWHVRIKELLYYIEKHPYLLKLLELVIHKGRRFTDPRLNVNFKGISFDNPMIVGAGWTKDGKAIHALYQALGFGGIEVGSVLKNPQIGNDKPRQFYMPNGVGINWLGFNSPGKKVVKVILDYYFSKFDFSKIPIGINAGKNKDVSEEDAPEAYASVVTELYPYASWLTLGVSSPNTPGVRALQGKAPLIKIVEAVLYTMSDRGFKPLGIKIAPDLPWSELDDVIDVASLYDLFIIASNTTNSFAIKSKYGNWPKDKGGLSGSDDEFRALSTAQIKYIYNQTSGKIPIMGVGNVKNTETALEKIQAGATVLALVTGLREEGFCIAHNTNTGLVEYMENNGVKHISELVGIDA